MRERLNLLAMKKGEQTRFKQANDENLKQNLKMESTGNLTTPLIQVFVALALASMSYLALTNLDVIKPAFRVFCSPFLLLLA